MAKDGSEPTLLHAPIHPDVAPKRSAPLLVETGRSETAAPPVVDLRAALDRAEAARRAGEAGEAEAILAGFLGSDDANAELAFSSAMNAEAAKDFAEARRRWRDVRERFPWHPYPWAAEAAMLCILKQYDDADATLSLASAQDIDTIELLAAGVQVAIERGDWLRAHERWTALEIRHPNADYIEVARERTYRSITTGLVSLDPAELQRLVDAAEDAGDRRVAVLLTDAARMQAPDHAHRAVAYGRALRSDDALEDADRFFCSQLDRFRSDIVFRANHAEIAGVRKNWMEAAERWRQVLLEFPQTSSVWSMAATAYREAGDLEAAEKLLARAVSSEPDRLDLRVMQALTAEKARDWELAVTRWDDALALSPNDANMRNLRGNAQWEQQIALLESPSGSRRLGEAAAAPDVPAPAFAAHSQEMRRLALSFEGLGDHCEFGIVQRRLGADPIGLFRFAAISAGDLTGLLKTRFAELGDPEQTELGLTKSDEYLVNDRRGLYYMHTFVQKGSADARAFLDQQIRRLAFLKKKLIEDLEAGEKIFAHKSSHRRIDDAALRDLAAALQSYGPNTLLGLRHAEPGHPAGTLHVLGHRLLVGYVAGAYGAEQMEIDLPSWQAVMTEARLTESRGWAAPAVVNDAAPVERSSVRHAGPCMDWLVPCEDFRARLRSASDRAPADCWRDLCALARSRLDFVQTNALDRVASSLAARHPDAFNGISTVRLAVLGSSTVSHLHPGLRVGCMRRAIRLLTMETGFGTYRDELFDPSSALAAFRPDYVLLALDGHHLARMGNPAMNEAEAALALDALGAELVAAWRHARSVLGATVLQQAALPLGLDLIGNNEHRLGGSDTTFIANLNDWMRRHADGEGVHILSVDRVAARHGLGAWHSPALWHRSKQEIALPAAPFYGDLVARLVSAIGGGSAKCLVLDLDNTLWGGVIGDDGLEGIVLGQGSAEGEAFAAVQRFALALSERGIILAVCSKNDEAVARRAFAGHPEMLLREDRIASFVANWDDKASNIRRIATELNIGLDAMVFLDDNPVERDLVRRELPAVLVPELPADPALYAQTLADAGYFESVAFTEEDRGRTGQYQANLERRVQSGAATDMDGYLRDLQMTLKWAPFDAIGLQRIVQLINKTNQFNLTTRRMTEDDVRRVIGDERRIGLQFRLLDRFGDNGVIAIVSGSRQDDDLYIDLWLMSCRVLGRRVEQATLAVLVSAARAQGCRRLIGVYRPTAKNAIVAEHYQQLGFAVTDAGPEETLSVLDLDDYRRPDLAALIEEMPS